MQYTLTITRTIRLGEPVMDLALAERGLYLAAACEVGLHVFDLTSGIRATYQFEDMAPFYRVVGLPGHAQCYVADAAGQIVHCELFREHEALQITGRLIYQADADIHSLALAGNLSTLAIGHLSPALTVLDADGSLRWRRHIADATPADGRIWAVALSPDGQQLYAGSAGAGENCLLVAATHHSQNLAPGTVRRAVTAVAALSGGHGVAAVLAGREGESAISLYAPDLASLRWSRQFDLPVTALCAHPEQPIVIAAVGYEGEIHLLDAVSGADLAQPLALTGTVVALDAAPGTTIAAAGQDEHVTTLRFTD